MKKSIDELRLFLTLDILTGCQFSCDGCFVNKTLPTNITEADLEKLIKVVKSFKDSGYVLELLTIGPTDLLVANNTMNVLTNDSFKEVLSLFNIISFQTTTLSRNNLNLISKTFKEQFPDKSYEISILIEPAHVNNNSYIEKLISNRKEIDEAFSWAKDLFYFGVMNVFDYKNTQSREILKNYDKIEKRLRGLVKTTIDFNFSLGRKKRNISDEDFKSSVAIIKNLHDEVLVNKDLIDNGAYNYKYQKTHSVNSSTWRNYIWRDGVFYYTPLLYEDFVSFNDDFKIDVEEGHIFEFDKFEEDKIISQYNNLGNKTECDQCQFLTTCVNKGTLFLMDRHNVKDCPISKNWFMTFFERTYLL